jgi:hypothetical protein
VRRERVAQRSTALLARSRQQSSAHVRVDGPTRAHERRAQVGTDPHCSRDPPRLRGPPTPRPCSRLLHAAAPTTAAPPPPPALASSRRYKDGAFDVEALERENDRGIDALSERIGLLKQVRACWAERPAEAGRAPLEPHTCPTPWNALLTQATHGIRSEVDSQHNILDRMVRRRQGSWLEGSRVGWLGKAYSVSRQAAPVSRARPSQVLSRGATQQVVWGSAPRGGGL